MKKWYWNTPDLELGICGSEFLMLRHLIGKDEEVGDQDPGPTMSTTGRRPPRKILVLQLF